MLFIRKLVSPVGQIRVYTIQLRHLRRNELEWETVSLPCFDVETCGSFGLDDALAMEKFDFILVRMSNFGFDIDM